MSMELYRICPGKINDDGELTTWHRACLLEQVNPTMGAPYVGVACRTRKGRVEWQSVTEGSGQDVRDDEGHTLVHFHRNGDSHDHKEFEVYLRNLIAYDSMYKREEVPWGDACNLGQA